MTHVQQFLSYQIRYFAGQLVANRKADIIRLDLRNSDALLRSLSARATTEPEKEVYFLTLRFLAYGRYQDMKRTYAKAGGTEMLGELAQWVETEGVSKFTKGKYAERYKGQSPERIANAIAWGITRKMKERGQGTRRRSWYNKRNERDIGQFYSELLRGYAAAVADDVKAGFTQK